LTSRRYTNRRLPATQKPPHPRTETFGPWDNSICMCIGMCGCGKSSIYKDSSQDADNVMGPTTHKWVGCLEGGGSLTFILSFR